MAKIENNPFLTDVFKKTWCKYFSKDKKIYKTSSFNISFVKSKLGLFFYNIGKNTTNGYQYYYTSNNFSFFKNKTLLLYDLPSYLKNEKLKSKRIKIKKSKQYPGVFTQLSNYADMEELLQKNFKAKKRAELKKFKKRLELCYDTKYYFYYNKIEKQVYDELIVSFFNLLEKRYAQKGIKNRNLSPKFKAYYTELIYKMVNNNKALFFVLKVNNTPIAMSLSFLSNDTLFYAIPVFDTDFSKFNLGHVSIMAIFDWCFKNNISIFDFSKGDGTYKDKWITDNYFFENHIIYDSYNLISILKAHFLKLFFDFKQFLRNIGMNTKIQKLKFTNKNKINFSTWSIEENKNYNSSEFEKILNYNLTNPTLNSAINEYLYKKSIKYSELQIYKHKTLENIYRLFYRNENIIIKIRN